MTDWNSCGRELEFLRDTRLNQVGEGLLSAVMGKILWLRTHSQSEVCTQRVRFFFDDLAGQFIQGEPWQASLLQPDRVYINEKFRETFDPNTLPFGQEDFDRQCEPLLTAATLVTDEQGHLGGAIDLDFQLSWFCMRKQINMALMRPVEVKNIGTSKLPCGFFKEPGDDLSTTFLADTGDGDWDVNVRDLLRLVYLDSNIAQPLLDTTTRDHILNDLITISGPLEADSYSIYECGNQERDTGSPQDRADERDWYEEGLFEDLGDLLDWLWRRILIFAGVAAALLIGYFVFGFQWLIPAGVLLGTAGVTIGYLRIPESENHLFMINSSRYLMNRLIIEALPDKDDRERYEDDQEEIKEWLLARLQKVASEDFREYNARPYQRYTIMAIMNLHDFAKDSDLEAASQIVLDLAAAKFAAGSSQGRRIVPFRRLLENIPQDYIGNPPRRLFDMVGGADHQTAAMLLFAGQTQQLPARKASVSSVSEMMYAASSNYRPDVVILNVAARKNVAYEQRIHHDGFEIYSSAAGYLISAGGVQTEMANVPLVGPFPFKPPKGLKFDADRGAAMPTVLFPNSPARLVNVADFLRIEGVREFYSKVPQNIPGVMAWSYDHNICVRQGFACGTNIVVPPVLDTPQCLKTATGAPAQWRFIDSAACPAYQGAPPFFVVIYRQPCIASGSECLFTANWGFFEAVDNPTISFQDFQKLTIDNNPASLTAGLRDPSSLEATYVSTRTGRIRFNVKGHEKNSDKYGIISVNGIKESDADDWDLASGDVIKADGHGKIEIRDPGSTRWIEIDFSDADEPKRTVH